MLDYLQFVLAPQVVTGLALGVARGSGPAVAQLGGVARQAGVPVSLHGAGGAWIVAGPAADPVRFGAAVRNSLDRPIARMKGAELEGIRFRHPLYDRDSIGVLADYVTLDAGTGAVHTAPGHGADDFELG